MSRSSPTRAAWIRVASAMPAAILFFLCQTAAAASGGMSLCSWPLETTGSGITNVAYPDTNATYWTMPLDRTRYKSMIIEGKYPQSRFFSFVSYTATGTDVDSLVDVEIDPNPKSNNPFRQGSAKSGRYTVTVGGSASPNNLELEPDSSTPLGWVIYRIYVPDGGLDRNAGVPLPDVTLVGYDGTKTHLRPCGSRIDALRSLVRELFDIGHGQALQALLSQIGIGVPSIGPAASCQPQDDVVFWIPLNTGGYFPNPANKYIAAPGLCFDRDKVLVVRGRGAGFPNTHAGDPVWIPAIPNQPIQMRYWSMCNNDQITPYPVVECKADWETKLDNTTSYTYVIGEERGNAPPRWLPAGVTWLPWGIRRVPNILIFRNMLPEDSFTQSIQYALSQGCTADNEPGVPPSREAVEAAGKCAAQLMGDYYPRAVYCDKQVLATKGWQGCFAAAGKQPR